MKIYCRMETGIGKKNIEDRVVVDNSIIAGGVYSADIPKMQPFVVAVADGVGGNNAGNVAAHVAAEGVVTLSMPTDCPEQVLSAKIEQLNAKIVAQSQYDPHQQRMATTLTGLYYTGTNWLLFHVGNCRAYSWKAPYLNQLTQDHTWARQMSLSGWTEEEIADSGRSSEITACLGNGDVSTAKQLYVSDVTEVLSTADCIILTCDGIHDFMKSEELEKGVNSIHNTPELLELSMAFARENGSQDDMSMVVVDLTS